MDEADVYVDTQLHAQSGERGFVQVQCHNYPRIHVLPKRKYLLNIKLPHGLKSIGQRAFSGCGRLCGTLELPSGVTAIEYGAFMGCDNLRHVLATGK